MQCSPAERCCYDAFCETLPYGTKTAFVFGEVVFASHSFEVVCQKSKRCNDKTVYELFPFFWATENSERKTVVPHSAGSYFLALYFWQKFANLPTVNVGRTQKLSRGNSYKLQHAQC